MICICKFCKKSFKKGKNAIGIYCSNSCQGQETSLLVFQAYIDNQIPSTLIDATGQIKRGVRKHLIALSNNSCSKCGWGEKRINSDCPPLEIDHIDGDWTNCKLSNLRVLCPNCHSLTPFYKGANRGRGREFRRK